MITETSDSRKDMVVSYYRLTGIPMKLAFEKKKVKRATEDIKKVSELSSKIFNNMPDGDPNLVDTALLLEEVENMSNGLNKWERFRETYKDNVFDAERTRKRFIRNGVLPDPEIEDALISKKSIDGFLESYDGDPESVMDNYGGMMKEARESFGKARKNLKKINELLQEMGVFEGGLE